MTIAFVSVIIIIYLHQGDFGPTPVAPLPMSRHRAIRNIIVDGNRLIDLLADVVQIISMKSMMFTKNNSMVSVQFTPADF